MYHQAYISQIIFEDKLLDSSVTQQLLVLLKAEQY